MPVPNQGLNPRPLLCRVDALDHLGSSFTPVVLLLLAIALCLPCQLVIRESRGWVCFSSSTVSSAWHRAQHTLGVWSIIQGAGLSPSLAGRMALLKSLCNPCAVAVAKGKANFEH